MTTQVEPFIISRTFALPKSAMWKAWTDPEQLERWSGPKGCKLTYPTHDFRPGGTYHYCMSNPDGTESWGKAIYREIDEPNRLVSVISFSDKDGNIQPHPLAENWPLEMLSTMTFEADEAGTSTTVTVEWLPVGANEQQLQLFDESRDGMTMGWSGSFEKLDRYVAEEQIRKCIEDWNRGLENRDIDAMSEGYADDILLFDLTPPSQRRGREDYRANWQHTFSILPDKFRTEIRDLTITAGNDVAFAHFQHRMVDEITGKNITCGWVRGTIGFEKQDGQWKVVHEHVSVPIDPQSQVAVFSE